MQPEVLLCMQISCLDPYVSGSGHRCGEAMCTLNILPFLYGWLGCRYTSCHQSDDKDPLLLPPGSTAVALWGKRIQNSQRRDLQEKSPSTAQASGGTKPMWVQISYFYTQQNEPELHNQLTGLRSGRRVKKMLEGDPGGGVRRGWQSSGPLIQLRLGQSLRESRSRRHLSPLNHTERRQHAPSHSLWERRKTDGLSEPDHSG